MVTVLVMEEEKWEPSNLFGLVMCIIDYKSYEYDQINFYSYFYDSDLGEHYGFVEAEP